MSAPFCYIGRPRGESSLVWGAMTNAEEPIAVTTAGRVRGEVDPRTGVRTFRGVPYGATTGGQGRFLSLIHI